MRKTLLQTITSVASELSLQAPQQVISATDVTTSQMYSLLISVCEELVQQYDWNMLQLSYTFTTVAAQEGYTLPSDCYKIINQTLYDRTSQKLIFGPKTPSEWALIKGSSMNSGFRERYRLQGNKIIITPVPTSVNTIAYDYQSYNYVIDASTNQQKAAFTSDSDLCVFDDRLIINALKLKYLESKGFDTTAAFFSYKQSLDAVTSADSGAPVLSLSPNNQYSLIGSNNLPDGNYNQ